MRALTAVVLMLQLMPVFAQSPTELKGWGREAMKIIRAVESMNDDGLAAAELKKARALIDKIKAADPAYVELGTLESRYKYVAGPIEGRLKEGAAASATSAARTEVAASRPAVIKDWEDIVKLEKDFRAKVRAIVPHAGGIIFDDGNFERVAATIEGLKKTDAPAVLAAREAFGRKYGTNTDAIDRKLFDLTPGDPRKSSLDPVNQRPDGSAGQAYTDLGTMLQDLEEAPRAAAKIILTNANNDLASAGASPVFDEVEASLRRAARLDPENTEVAALLAKVRTLRAQSQADREKAIQDARFPQHAKSFRGPGSVRDLVEACLAYYREVYSKEKPIAVSIAGDWLSAKTNLLGETIQWGLPVYVAAVQNDSQDTARVFRMTVLGALGPGAKKSPPFTDHWTGDSFLILIKNIQ